MPEQQTLFFVIWVSLVVSFAVLSVVVVYLGNKAIHLVDNHLERLQSKLDVAMAQQTDNQELLHVILRKM